MQNKNKKTAEERRATERYNVALDIEWSADRGLQPGRLNDVSAAGCFVLAGGKFEDGEVVRVYFPMTDGTRVEFVGEIINNVEDVGFGVRFVNLTDIQRQYLQDFAELHQSDMNKPAAE